MTATLSAKDSASAWSWVTKMLVMPARVSSSATALRVATRRPVSSAEKGSSSSISLGRSASARASATRCCCPPEISCGLASNNAWSRATMSINSSMRVCLFAALRGMPKPTLSATLRCGNSAPSCGTNPISRRWAGTACLPSAIRRPARKNCPDVGASKPAMMRSSVVLPEPDGPTMAVRLPVVTCRSMPCSTGVLP